MEKTESPESDGTKTNEQFEGKAPAEVVKEVKAELAEYRRPFEKPWREETDAYYGKQHKTGEDRKTTKNHIFKIIEGEIPILTDSMPGSLVTANIAEKQQDADILNKSIEYVYQDQNIPLTLPTVMRNACIGGPGFKYVRYNPDAKGGEGAIEYIIMPWKNVWLDGNASTIEAAERAHLEFPMRKEACARIWPEKYAEIMATKPGGDESSRAVDDGGFEDRDVSGPNAVMGAPRAFRGKDVGIYSETWVKSYDTEPIPPEEQQEEIAKEREGIMSGAPCKINKWANHAAHIQSLQAARGEVLAQLQLPPEATAEQADQVITQALQANPEAEQLKGLSLTLKMLENQIEEHATLAEMNPKGERPKYKDGWRVIRMFNNVLLDDGGNPLEDGHIPLVPFYCYKDDTIYGLNEVKNILDAQRTLNDADWREFESLQVVSNPGWISDHEAEVPDGALHNRPGIHVKKKRGTEVRRLEAGQVSPQLAQRKEMDEMDMEEISGVNEASQGGNSTAKSGIAIQKLQTQAIGRIRLKDRYLNHYSMRRLAIITASFILKYWGEEKSFRLRSDNSSIEEFVFNPLAMADLEYTIDVSSGSMAGIDKDSLNQLYIQLYTASGGAMTFEDLLTVIDIPKKDTLLARIKERQQQEQQQAQVIEQGAAEIQSLQSKNAQLLGLISPELVDGDQKKEFEAMSRAALIERLMAEGAQQAMPQQPNGNPGANEGQPETQG